MSRSMLQSVLLAAAVVTMSLPAAAIPEVVSYAAEIENDAGPFDGTASIAFQLFDAATAGTELWTESVASAAIVDGLLVHELGSIEALDTALLSEDALFLQVTINGETLDPRTPLLSVPFALRAREADTAVLADTADRAIVADNASQLGGRPASSFQFSAGDGLALNGVTFSVVNGGITTAKLANAAVVTTTIANRAVTATKIAEESVASEHIVDSTITAADIRGETLRYGVARGCGSYMFSEGGEQRCQTVPCLTSSGVRFFDCNATQCTATSPVLCSASSTQVVGKIPE